MTDLDHEYVAGPRTLIRRLSFCKPRYWSRTRWWRRGWWQIVREQPFPMRCSRRSSLSNIWPTRQCPGLAAPISRLAL